MDTTRADRLGSYGSSPEATPNIDAIAHQGIVFEHAVSPSPLTQPSHSTMFTGLNPIAHGVRDNDGYKLGDFNTTLAEFLQKEGLSTAAIIGAQVLDPMYGFAQGFDRYDARISKAPEGQGDYFFGERSADEVEALAIDFLDEGGGEPFFLFLHFFDAHAPHRAPTLLAARSLEAQYAAEIAAVDGAIGRVVDHLKRLGRYDETLIIITADHGESLGRHREKTHSYFIYQDTQHVPLVIRAPGLRSSSRVDAAVGLVDLLPTVLELLGIGTPDGLDGESLVPYLTAEPTSERSGLVNRQLYIESFVPTDYGCTPLVGVVSDRWKYIHTRRPELYDLRTDPGESQNLFESEPDVAIELERELRRLASATSARVSPSESRMTLDPETRHALEKLGYISGTAIDERIDFDDPGVDPKDRIRLHRRFSNVLLFKGMSRYEEADRILDKITARHPDLALAHYYKGTVSMSRERYQEAIGHFREQLARMPGLDGVVDAKGALRPGTRPFQSRHAANAHELIGIAHARGGDFEGAQEHFRLSLKLQPENVEIRMNYAHALRQAGRTEEAVEQYRGVLEREPRHRVARHWLRGLDGRDARVQREGSRSAEGPS